jgi:hypothetical protein
MKRRDFLKGGAAFGAVLGGIEARPALAGTESKFVQAERSDLGSRNVAIVNARVLTMESSQPTAQAVLVRNGRITHVGSTSEVKANAGDTRVFDVAGRTVVPGFIDAHTHIEVALSHERYAVDVHAPPLRSIREIQNALAAKAAATPKGQWVIGRAGFNLENGLAEKRLPNRQDLDEVSQDHPVIIFSGRHISMLNTRALEQIGMWDPATAKPPKGTTIHRNASGVPTGLATECSTFCPTSRLNR